MGLCWVDSCISAVCTNRPCPPFPKAGESGGTFACEVALRWHVLPACQTVVGYVFLTFRHGDFNSPETREIGNGGSFGPSKTAFEDCLFCEMARLGLQNVPFYDAKRVVLGCETSRPASRFSPKTAVFGRFLADFPAVSFAHFAMQCP